MCRAKRPPTGLPHQVRATLPASATGTSSFHARTVTLPYGSKPWTTTLVAADTTTAPPPPGLPRFPAPGETWLSPALQAMSTHDPAVAQRVPGTRAGLISRAGLVSPDQLLAIVGRPAGSLNESGASNSWGRPGPGDSDDALIPGRALLLTAATLIGIPLLFFALTINRLSSTARTRRTAALHLLGVPQRTLARASSVEAGILAATGTVAGLGLGTLCIPFAAGSGIFGVKWFATDTVPSVAQILLTVLLVTLTAAKLGAIAARRDLDASLTIRRDASTRARAIRLLPLATASGVLITLILVGAAYPDKTLATSGITILYIIASGAAVGGALYALPWITHVIALRIVQPHSSVAVLLAGRRLAHDASASARMAGGIVLMIVTSLLGLAVVVDLQSQVTLAPAGHTMEILFPHSTAPQQIQDAVRTAPAATRALRISLDNRPSAPSGAIWGLTVVTCHDLITLVGQVATTQGTDCRDNQVYRLASGDISHLSAAARHRLPTPTPISLKAPHLLASALSGTTLIVTQAPSRWADLAPGGDLVALPGPGEAAADRFTTQILRAAPLASVNYDDVDMTSIYRLPIIRHLVLACSGLGLLAALATFLIAAGDRGRERRREKARLNALDSFVGTVSVRAAMTCRDHSETRATARTRPIDRAIERFTQLRSFPARLAGAPRTFPATLWVVFS